jgi:hypothetical protein
MKSAVAIAILVSVSWVGVAVADILEWQDADGVSHYTNLKGEIPKEQEGATRVVVDEAARQSAAPSPPAVAEEPAPRAPEPQAQTEVVSDRTDETDAYVRGVLRGIESARSAADDRGDTIVQINGPLAIVDAATPAAYSEPSYPWLYPPGYPPGFFPGWYAPGFFPGVGTPFGHGRLRHWQRQAKVDSFLFNQRVIPPAGPPPLGVAWDPVSRQERIVPPAGLPPLGVGPNLLSPRLTGRAAGGGISRGTRGPLH